MSPLALSLRFLQTQPDARLVELSKAGHERAFEALVQRYRRPLLAYCRRITSSEASAEDALQQALLQAWVALSTSDVEVRDARAWLYRIVHNVAISNLRRVQPDAVEVEDAEGVSGADHEVERRLAVREALAGLASLPELQRQVMLSTALEGRSHDEIASALGLSNGAVRGLIYRARAALRAAAAAVTPAPVVHWAVRQQASGTGRSAGLYEAIVGGGGAGLGGVIFKGGAIVVSAGAIATAAGITNTHSSHRVHRATVATAAGQSGSSAHAVGAGATGAAAGATVAGAQLVSATTGGSHRRGEGAGRRSGHGRGSGSRGHGDHAVLSGGSSHDHSGGGGSGNRGGHQSASGSSGHGGTDGGHGGSGDSGSRSGSDGGSGGSGGHDGSQTGGRTSSGGGSGGDHGGGGEGSTLSSSTTVTSTSGGSGDGRDGGSGGDGGGGSTTTGSTTTVTTTSTTTSASATSGD